MFRPQEISATEARKYFSQIINKVQFSSKSFVIKSYRKPVVRIVKEDYIAILEQVLGKKTVGQILEISGNDNLFEARKKEEIKKIFQRRLSGSSQQQPRPKPQPPSQPQRKRVAARPASPPVSKPQQTKPQPKPQPPQKSKNPKPRTSDPHHPTTNNRGALLLANGKNYK